MPRRIAFGAVLLIFAALLGVVTLPGEKPAKADATQYAHIAGTDIGIYFRHDENNWESRKQALAGWDGELVTLKCALTGMPVGPNNNTIWYEASTRYGEGKLPDAFLDTPKGGIPGFLRCGEQSGQPTQDEQRPERPLGPIISSVFFSPERVPQGLEDLTHVAQRDLPLGSWKSDTQCSDDTAAKRVPATTTVMAGWSLGRLGVIYSLNTMGEERANRVQDIILFDPGNTSDFAKGDEVTCDWRYDINGILAKWLEAKKYHRLYIMSGSITKVGTDKNPQTDFAGIWEFYLAGVWSEEAGKQVTICNYDGMDHKEVLRRFASMVDKVPDACPSGPRLTEWHPAS